MRRQFIAPHFYDKKIKCKEAPFEQPFIRVYEILVGGNRYKLLLSGLGVTLQVTVFSAFFGVVLGLLLAVMKLGDKSKGILRIPYIISSAYIDVIRGTPSVVQLLIIYHIVFGGIKNVPPVIIAIIAFAINSVLCGRNISGGILAVDIGQTEAGISLGLSRSDYAYVVVPQALKNAFPALANEFIVLMKETAIVGYIARRI